MRCSIIIPTYNRAQFLRAAIDSVLGQMADGDELIVVDDGSSDDTPAILRSYAGRIVAIEGGHGGAGRARNLGIARAQSELVAFLDSDDRWFPGKLAIQRAFMERRPDVLFTFTNFEVEFRDGSVQPHYLDRWQRSHATWEEAFGAGVPYTSFAALPEGIDDFPVYEGDLYRLQLTGFYVLTDTLVARKAEAGDALRFAEDLPTYEDLDCFYRLSRRGKSAFLDVDTVRQLDHPHGRLSQRAQLEKIDARIELVRRNWGQDERFLAQHGASYRAALDRLLLQRAGHLISQGANGAARATLREMWESPLTMRLAALLPSWMTLAGLRMRRSLGRSRAGSR